MLRIVATPTRRLISGSLCTGFLLTSLLFAQASFGDDETPAEASCAVAGPQSPRDIDQAAGRNPVLFSKAPDIADLKLCDIHFHKFAEHKAKAYSTQAGTGDHQGFACQGHSPHSKEAMKKPAPEDRSCGTQPSNSIAAGDTVEVHWVFTTCNVEPAPGLKSCFNPVCQNPQFRVEARVFYLTEGGAGSLDFADISNPDALEIPQARRPVEYLGSTTGPTFNNETCSPFQVTWNVSRACKPLDLASLNSWCGHNVFKEYKAHGVRELVTPSKLLSQID